MPEGGVVLATVTGDDETVSLTIRDEGAGVPESIRAEIFNPFFTTKAKGTGLGLAKVQSVAEAHAGHVRCESPVGQSGATFTMTLPRSKSGAEPSGRRARKPAECP